jgi:hypothetical protein
LQSVIHRVDAERAELELVLSSKTFGRNNYVGRFLSFVCERYFEGSTSEIKEYSIAVHALGRQPDFDPQSDTIVRVTAHNLRKRLELYYASEGADHPVQICLPPGHYVPQFVHRGEPGARTHDRYTADSPELESESSEIFAASDSGAFIPSEASLEIPSDPASTERPSDHRTRNLVAALAAILIALLAAAGYRFWLQRSQAEPAEQPKTPAVQLMNSGSDIHALMGADRAPFVDRAGVAWQRDHFCSGGSSFSVTGHTIQGTEDPQLFSAGRHGAFRCKYPVPPGVYEVHLLFAETEGMQENGRHVDFSINDSPGHIDVVDDAGGDDIATTKIYADIQPGSDGLIHIDFITENSIVNAIEILPSTPHHMLPVRIAAGSSAYRDTEGNTWLEDRYFFGGRVSSYAGTLSGVPDGRLYVWHRFGHFHYIIPVATGEKYTLKLHFLEHWFGAPNGGTGGAGSRVFDVSCNGSMLLKNFDIYSEAGSKPLVKTFPHIEPTALGKIELYFTPAVNYPSISGIEIIPE